MRNRPWKSLLLTASLVALPSWGAGRFLKSADAIPGQYIVVLKEDRLGNGRVPEVAQALAREHGAAVTRTYSHALRGFVARTDEAGARALAARPEVAYVSEDGRAWTAETQTDAPWNLDRIDQVNRAFPRWGYYSYSTSGNGVHVYVIDSGIKTNHPDFGGRATADKSFIDDGYGAEDCNGHGTHVAGTVGGTTWGVAKRARLHSVRVNGCGEFDSSASLMLAGVDWVTANHIKPAVVNMSMITYADTALDEAVRNAIRAGVVFVVGAGNANMDACSFSPGRVTEAITVGATDDTDSRATGMSNHGPCLDLFAPGMWINSATLDGSYGMKSGTSMAAPHVAGVAAQYLESHPGATPSTVRTAVVFNSPQKVTNAGAGSPTRLLHTTPLIDCGKLDSGQSLIPGRTLSSCAGTARLIHQGDGNVVIYDRLGALWSTATWNRTTSTFIMQPDGNLVLYTGTGEPLWHALGNGNAGAYLMMQNDCNLVMYSASGVRLWESRTACR